MQYKFLPTTLALVAWCASAPARADDAEQLKALAQKLEANMRIIEALQKRVDQLERKEAPTAATALGARLETVERTVTQIEAASAAATQADTGLPLHGFVDIGGGVRNSAATAAPRGFSLGTLDLYMTPQISQQVKGLIEIAFEFASGDTVVDVERLQLGYAFSDALTLWAGRFHTPYGIWNTAFHHGAQLQTALSRPKFLDFEDKGGVLPAHSVGLWATGNTRTAAGRLGYDLYAVNGDRIKAGVLDYQAAGDGDGNLGLGLRASLDVTGSGLTLGLHGLKQKVAGSNGAGTATGRSELNMLGAFASYDNDDWEALAEFYRFSNRDLADGKGTRGSKAWYVQLGRNLNDQFTPYLRLERAALDGQDSYFALQDSGVSYRRTVAGLRYNLTPKSALKAEWTRTSEDRTPGTPSTLALQYAARF